MNSGLQLLVDKLGIPGTIITIAIVLYSIVQLIGELIELKGKIVPEWMKIRKFFKRKKDEKIEAAQLQLELKQLLSDVNAHYSADNIKKRDSWMDWVNQRAKVYDAALEELTALKSTLDHNNELTLELYINASRNRIIDFASKVANAQNTLISHEEFRRVFKIYDEYEQILKDNKRKNGEVDVAYKVIKEGYKERLEHHSFLEDVRGY